MEGDAAEADEDTSHGGGREEHAGGSARPDEEHQPHEHRERCIHQRYARPHVPSNGDSGMIQVDFHEHRALEQHDDHGEQAPAQWHHAYRPNGGVGVSVIPFIRLNRVSSSYSTNLSLTVAWHESHVPPMLANAGDPMWME